MSYLQFYKLYDEQKCKLSYDVQTVAAVWLNLEYIGITQRAYRNIFVTL